MARKKSIVDDGSNLRDIETYLHKDKSRKNNPKAGLAAYDKADDTVKTYSFDPHLTPTLDWAGKKERLSFEVPTSSIHIHEKITPHKIIRSVRSIGEGEDQPQLMLAGFESPIDRMNRKTVAIEAYQHSEEWTNRLIAGDSLVIMNSLLEKEGMAGQVQMVYIDPPYGIKYGSNFQPFVNKRDVKEKDEDLTQEPEMIKAFRDTWELGIHSYLTYLRDRLLLAKELLADTGSIFVQISDENVHHVREICDEVFGKQNFISQIIYTKTGGFETNTIGSVADYILWYAKNATNVKIRKLYIEKDYSIDGSLYSKIELPDGSRMSIGEWEKKTNQKFVYNSLPKGHRVYRLSNLSSQGTSSSPQPYELDGKIYYPSKGNHWKANYPEGMNRLKELKRIAATPNSLQYVRYYDDFPCIAVSNVWTDTGTGSFLEEKLYVVQSGTKAVQRCLLMTTDPSDLVLDPTCGSGTTAKVAEQWGRRWITCDTSRVAITLAKQRLMTATYDYYKLAHKEQGVSGGFVYKTVPHITLKSLANNEPPSEETLYDQPEVDKSKVRITGPFTVEALPAPTVMPLDDTVILDEDLTAKENNWCEQLRATGIMGRGGARLMFSRVEMLSGTKRLQAEAETIEDTPRRAVICFAGETKPLDSRMVSKALDEAEKLRPTPQLVIFAAFQFDPEAAKFIEESNWPGVTLLKAQMNTDLMTEDLKKKRSSDQSFWLVGQPDVELIRDGRSKNRFKVKVNGFDYYDVKSGTVESGSTSKIAMWMLDKDYDGMCVEPCQVFFPMGGSKDGWNKLAKTLRAEINQELIEKYAGNESLWFTAEPDTQIAIKIIDDRGIESLKVIRIGDE